MPGVAGDGSRYTARRSNVGPEDTMRLRGTLLWEADGEPRRDAVLISDERPNGAGSHIVILDDSGQRRAASPDELPPESVLLLPSDASDRDADLIQDSGYTIRRIA